MSAYEISGTIKVIFDTMTFNSGFQKREFVITTDDDKYPQDIKLQVTAERCGMLDSLKAGQRVKAAFRLRGNEYKGKYYTDLQAFKVDPDGSGGGQSSAPPQGDYGSYGGGSGGGDFDDPF